MMYKTQFQKKIFPYDWFCGPGSHIYTKVNTILYHILKINTVDNKTHNFAMVPRSKNMVLPWYRSKNQYGFAMIVCPNPMVALLLTF